MHDLEASPKLDGSSSKPRVKEVSSEEKDNVSHIEIKITEYHSSDEKCVLRYLNLSDNAMGNYGVNAFESLLSSQNNLRELYLMNMARLNMCHNMREWHCDAIRKIKWLNENEISVMINTEGQANYEGFFYCIKYGEELTFKLLLYFQAVKAKSLGFTKLGLIVLGNGRLSDLIAQLQDILEGVNEADILPEKFDNAVIKAQIPQLAREIRELTSSRPVTIYNENSSSSGNYASYLVPLAALAAMGYCYMWWRDWSFSDVMYVTRHNMANVVEALIREAEWLNRVTKITKFGSFMVQLDRSVEALNKGKKQKTRDGGYGDEIKRLHDLSVNKVVDMATRFESALVGHVNNIICSTTVRLERLHSDDWWCSAISQLLMIGKSIVSSSNKTQEANVDAVLGTGDPSLLVENTSVEQLGFVRKVTIFKDSTSIIGDAASKDGLQVHGVSPFDIMGRNLFWEKQLQRLQMGAVTRKFLVVNFSSGFDESSYLSRVENFEEMSQENYGEATGNKNSLTQFKRAAIPGRIIMISKSSSTIPFLSLEDKANFQGGSIVMTQIITEVLCFITVRNC
ncbi:hypothetical protein DVH24_024503 [Malus domestica]|uniref:DUF7798 domain-containing protein n=1 Tax=Malus domestica TaxID=3750 RepID=A0A498JG55_MALDO|nr:hypothetical protein DVH24_024503 [Malus domestica]